MYRYFVSFKFVTGKKTGVGNVVLESNHKISDFNNVDNMQQWVDDAQKWIENKINAETVIIINFILIN